MVVVVVAVEEVDAMLALVGQRNIGSNRMPHRSNKIGMEGNYDDNRWKEDQD